MKQAAGLVLALASAAPAVASEPAPQPRMPPDGADRAALAALLNTRGAEAALAEGRAFLATNNAVQAISAFRQALSADQSSVAALNGLGVAYDRLGRSDLARRHFEQALSLDPEAADIAYNLGWSLHLAGEHRAAVPWLQRAAGGDDGRAAAAARRALVMIAARLEAEALGPAMAPAALPDAPVRVASARIDMASTGEAVLVLGTDIAHPAAARPVLALSVPVDQLITASLSVSPVDMAELNIAMPDLGDAIAAEPVTMAQSAAPATRQLMPQLVVNASADAERPPPPVRDMLSGRLGALAALTIPLAAPMPAVATPVLAPPAIAAPAARTQVRTAAAPAPVPAAQLLPQVITLGDTPPDFSSLSPSLPDLAEIDGPPPLRLLDLAALPLLATATPMQPVPLLAPPVMAVDWLAVTDIEAIAPSQDAPAYRRLVDALLVQADLADAVDPRAVRLAIDRLEALVARIGAISLEVMSA
jgi:tetratricopeptide (TPR) repeat protein